MSQEHQSTAAYFRAVWKVFSIAGKGYIAALIFSWMCDTLSDSTGAQWGQI